MNKPFWAIAGVALLGTAGVAGAIVVTSSGGEEEVVQQAETATAGASEAPATLSATPSFTPLPSSSATPEGWLSYRFLDFTFRYPPDWYSDPSSEKGGSARVASWDLSAWDNPRYPIEGVLVDVGRIVPDEPGVPPPDAVAVDESVGGMQGWMRKVVGGSEAPWSKLLVWIAERGGYRYAVQCYFQDLGADEAVCQKITSSIEFSE